MNFSFDSTLNKIKAVKRLKHILDYGISISVNQRLSSEAGGKLKKE